MSDDILKAAHAHLNTGTNNVYNKQYEPVFKKHGYRFDNEFSTAHSQHGIDIWVHDKLDQAVTVHPVHGFEHEYMDQSTDWDDDYVRSGKTPARLDFVLTKEAERAKKPKLLESNDDLLNQAHNSLADTDDYETHKRLISNKSLTAIALDKMARAKSITSNVMQGIAGHDNVLPETLHYLANVVHNQNHMTEAKISIASSPKANADTLHLFRRDHSSQVREAVVSHPNASEATLKRMTLDWHPGIRTVAQRKLNLK